MRGGSHEQKEREEGLHEQQQKELIRLLKWIQKNSAMWEVICNPSGMEYSPKLFMRHMKHW